MEALKPPTLKEQKIAGDNKEIIDRIIGKHQNSSKQIEIEISGEMDKVKIPVSVFRYLSKILEYMAQGNNVTFIPSETEVTTQQAADMLNVSRPHVVKLLEEGKLPFRKVGTHRRIKLKDLNAYLRVMEKERKEALSELTRLSQELDLDH